MNINVFILSVAAVWGCLFAQVKSDFLVVQNIQAFSILSRFEQPLTSREERGFPKGAPFLMVDSNGTLGDQITPAARIAYLGEPYYLLKKGDGRFIGADAAKDFKIFRGCAGFGDTLTVSAGKRLTLSATYPDQGGKTALSAGTKAIRAFQFRGHLYLVVLGANARAGWCPVSAGKVLFHAEKALMRDKSLSRELKEKILDRFASANRAYEQYFGYFNTLTGEQKSIPRWKSETDGLILRWRLYGRTAPLEESTQCLVRDIEGALLGKPFSIAYENSVISISPEQEGR